MDKTATQAGLPTIWPILEQKQRDGTWKNLGEIGLPAGLPRVMTKEVTGWIDPAGDGVIPGKLFEYIGARRPILSLGSLSGEAAAIVRDNRLGLASNDPEEIKAMLVACLAAKARLGRLPDLLP